MSLAAESLHEFRRYQIGNDLPCNGNGRFESRADTAVTVSAPRTLKLPNGRCEIEGTFELSFLPPPPPWSYRKWCADAIASYRARQNPSGIERKRP